MTTQAVAFYGSTRYRTKVKVSYKQRYWKRRKDGVRQRYTKRVTAHRTRMVKGGQRLTVYGSPEQVKQVKHKVASEGWIPKKKYVDRVNAEVFLQHPRKYARHGKWTKFEEQES